MSISIDEVRHVARLARLELEETEILSFQTELNALLGHFADIQSVDVTGFEAVSHAVSVQNVWADDLAWISLPREQALKNAPVSRAGLFVVPQIIED
ncbi:MAG TPA: Asp-tRNA(Asn)/Glu-tRNA(Gln) amidotransferase subunit GatC [Fimbriimonas sp.]|nr:Asp-tRNA(Asn)/Glu-tRNA(Gln) amidotransferase subunit GatC [Fimbriimonas sp.]